MNDIFQGLGDIHHVGRVLLRLVVACILGGVIGFEREYEHKRAGMRTHILVALGSALFTLITAEMGLDASRVIQGIAAGVGFLGAGTIFKLTEQMEVKGLTTAACIWVTAALGTAVGVGLVWPALIAVVLGWLVLYVLHPVEDWLRNLLRRADSHREHTPQS